MVVAEGNEDNKISTLEYNNRTVYDCFNNPFTADCGSPAMHLPPITIDDRPPPPPKRARYAPNLFPATISVASENSVSTLTTPSDLKDILPTDGPKTLHVSYSSILCGLYLSQAHISSEHGEY